ncbi:MAG: YicC/YloC family endoribonuclease [Oscillospiraceae bacterium]
MIKSMTGYGRAQASVDGSDILVEIKSVNNRYYDFSARLPRMYGYLEEKLKTFLSGSISRGKIEVSVSIYNNTGKDEEITLNLDVANGYINALRNANESLGLTDDITLSQVSRFPDVFIVKKIIEDEESVWNNIRPVAEEAVAKFVSMRETEGAKMKDDLLSRLDFILKEVEKVEIQSPKTTENYRNRLYQKLKEVLSDNNIDEQRIVTEAAIFSEKIAVDEETVRLRSHISQFKELLETSEPVGRKLDFLVQEMNREANTIGSKAQDVAITKIVVDIKSEIEKIREQIQNIE